MTESECLKRICDLHEVEMLIDKWDDKYSDGLDDNDCDKIQAICPELNLYFADEDPTFYLSYEELKDILLREKLKALREYLGKEL